MFVAYIGLVGGCTIGNKSVPKIITNNTLKLFFFKLQSISILVISNRNSFRVLFDEIASVYILLESIFIF